MKRAQLKAVLGGRVDLVLESNEHVVELDVVVSKASGMDALKHSEHGNTELKDTLVGHLATLFLEVVFEVTAISWHNHVRHQNRLLLLEKVVRVLNDHSILNYLWD